MQSYLSKRLLCRFALAMLLAGSAGSIAQAQYPPQGQYPSPGQYGPQQGQYQAPALQRPTMQTQGSSGGSTYNFNNTNGGGMGGFGGGYGGFGGWGGYYPGVVGGALQGVASVTNANGEYLQQTQQARIMKNAANQGELDYRQRLLEQWRYEQSLKPTPEDLKDADMQRALRRARSGPPNNEIWSGVALNTLCDSIKRAQLSGMRGPLVPIDPNVLQHINLNGGTSNGSAGMFKNGGQLQWPLILQTGNYKDDRAKIDELSRKLFQQATSGQVDADTLFGLKELVERLSNKIDEDTPSLSMNQSIQATRFINELKTSLRAMQDPNVTKQFNGQWSAQGNNVAALVDNLANKGLSFSSATPGNETYYTSLYNNFLSYDMALSQLASAKNPQVQTVPQPQPNR